MYFKLTHMSNKPIFLAYLFNSYPLVDPLTFQDLFAKILITGLKNTRTMCFMEGIHYKNKATFIALFL